MKDSTVVNYSPRQTPSWRLFCFPFAGGSAATFWPWARQLPAGVSLHALQLPGRWGSTESFSYSCLEELCASLLPAIQARTDLPFAFFGHSMGALLAYEITLLLQGRGEARPAFLAVAAMGAPHLPPREGPKRHLMPDAQLLEEIRRLKGAPEDLLRDREFLATIFSTLRADFKLVENYRKKEVAPVSCPVVALGGADDPEVPPSRLEAWKEVAPAGFQRITLPGGHFFIQEQSRQILKILIEHPAAPRAGIRQKPS